MAYNPLTWKSVGTANQGAALNAAIASGNQVGQGLGQVGGALTDYSTDVTKRNTDEAVNALMVANTPEERQQVLAGVAGNNRSVNSEILFDTNLKLDQAQAAFDQAETAKQDDAFASAMAQAKGNPEAQKQILSNFQGKASAGTIGDVMGRIDTRATRDRTARIAEENLKVSQGNLRLKQDEASLARQRAEQNEQVNQTFSNFGKQPQVAAGAPVQTGEQALVDPAIPPAPEQQLGMAETLDRGLQQITVSAPSVMNLASGIYSGDPSSGDVSSRKGAVGSAVSQMFLESFSKPLDDISSLLENATTQIKDSPIQRVGDKVSISEEGLRSQTSAGQSLDQLDTYIDTVANQIPNLSLSEKKALKDQIRVDSGLDRVRKSYEDNLGRAEKKIDNENKRYLKLADDAYAYKTEIQSNDVTKDDLVESGLPERKLEGLYATVRNELNNSGLQDIPDKEIYKAIKSIAKLDKDAIGKLIPFVSTDDISLRGQDTHWLWDKGVTDNDTAPYVITQIGKQTRLLNDKYEQQYMPQETLDASGAFEKAKAATVEAEVDPFTKALRKNAALAESRKKFMETNRK